MPGTPSSWLSGLLTCWLTVGESCFPRLCISKSAYGLLQRSHNLAVHAEQLIGLWQANNLYNTTLLLSYHELNHLQLIGKTSSFCFRLCQLAFQVREKYNSYRALTHRFLVFCGKYWSEEFSVGFADSATVHAAGAHSECTQIPEHCEWLLLKPGKQQPLQHCY